MRSHTVLTKFITSCFRDCTISITNILIYYFFNMRHPISRCHNNIRVYQYSLNRGWLEIYKINNKIFYSKSTKTVKSKSIHNCDTLAYVQIVGSSSFLSLSPRTLQSRL